MSRKYFEVVLNIVGTEDGDLEYTTKELGIVLKDHIKGFPQAELEALTVRVVDEEYHNGKVLAAFNKSHKEE